MRIRTSPKLCTLQLEHSDPPLGFILLPRRHPVEVIPGHVEGHLKVSVAKVLFQVAPIEVGRQLIVGGEEHMQRVNLVFAGKDFGVVVSPRKILLSEIDIEKQ